MYTFIIRIYSLYNNFYVRHTYKFTNVTKIGLIKYSYTLFKESITDIFRS